MELLNLKYILSQNVIYLTSPPTLEYQATLKIALTLWQLADIHEEIVAIFISESKCNISSFKSLEKKIVDRLCFLPNRIVASLSYAVVFVGQEIFAYLLYQLNENNDYNERNKFVRLYLNSICWTEQATIDKVKSASLLARSPFLTKEKRYKIACLYCIEEEINNLFHQLPGGYWSSFQYRPGLVEYWTNCMKRKYSQTNAGIVGYQHNIYGCLEITIRNRNDVAVEYFWKVCPNQAELRRAFMQMAITRQSSTNILFYFLSQMSREQKLEFISSDKRHVYILLEKLLLDVRWLPLFSPSLEGLSAFVSEMDYIRLLEKSIDCLKQCSYYGDKYRGTFQNLISLFPSYTRNYLNKNKVELWLWELLKCQDFYQIQVMTEFLSSVEKKQIIFSSSGICHCSRLLERNELHLLQRLIHLMLDSEADIAELNKQINASQSFEHH